MAPATSDKRSEAKPFLLQVYLWFDEVQLCFGEAYLWFAREELRQATNDNPQ